MIQEAEGLLVHDVSWTRHVDFDVDVGVPLASNGPSLRRDTESCQKNGPCIGWVSGLKQAMGGSWH